MTCHQPLAPSYACVVTYLLVRLHMRSQGNVIRPLTVCAMILNPEILVRYCFKIPLDAERLSEWDDSIVFLCFFLSFFSFLFVYLFIV